MILQKTLYSKLLDGQEVFGSFETAFILGIEKQDFRNLMKQGYVPNGSKVQWGNTVRTVFSRFDLYSIALFHWLKRQGISNQNANQIMEFVRWDEVDISLIVYDGFNYLSLNEKWLKSINLRDYDTALFLNLKSLRRKVDIRITESGLGGFNKAR